MNKKLSKNIPLIRFKGFSDEWELCKIEKLLTERNELAPMSDEYPLMAFIANEGVAPKGERYDRSSLVSDTKNKLYKRTKYQDFIYSSNNLVTGSIGVNKFGNASISPVYSIFSVTGLADSDFLGWRLVKKDFISAMVKWRQGVVYGQWRIHESDFVKIKIPVPSVEEQRKIGACFDNIDRLITLYQQELDSLKNVKKLMLNKLFPNDKKEIPELRFKGFSNDWEQRKLRELTTLITKGTTPLGKPRNGIINYIKIESIDSISGEITINSKISEEEHNGYLKRSQLQEGDVLFSIAGTLGRVTTVHKDILPANTNQALAIIRLKKCNINFITTYLKGKSVTDFVKKNPTVGAQPNLSLKQVGDLKIAISCSDEQDRIGDFFLNLDNYIALHQREIERLKSLKKILSNHMFI